MQISYHWLQTYFNTPLPSPEKIAEMLTSRAYEVEKTEKVEEDTVFEVDVLPNRAHDSLCHRGVARELGILLGVPVKISERTPLATDKVSSLHLSVAVEDSELCRRYMGRVVEGIKIGPSPEWLVKRLASIGQRSINNVVDATNFVMFDMGQPLHAFDAEKLSREEDGSIKIFARRAKSGEKLATLDGKDVALDESMLVIADTGDALAIAGVKGGKKAEIDADTETIVLEAANFHPTAVRKTSQKIGIRTDSSKRFENEIHPTLAEIAIEEVAWLIAEIANGEEGIRTGEIIDEFPACENFLPREVSASLQEINTLLGVELSEKDGENILKKLGWEYRKENQESGIKFFVTSPLERLDISLKEDLIEEIGRVHGYENISARLPEQSGFTPVVNKEFYYSNAVRNILQKNGFSEVFTYSFVESGEREMQNPIAEDKKFLRPDLSFGIKRALEHNLRYADFLLLDAIKIFEIGRVFGASGESVRIALAIAEKKPTKKKGDHPLDTVIDLLERELGVEMPREHDGQIWEADFGALIEHLPTPESYGQALDTGKREVKFEKISPYPFTTRDIALFVPEKTSAEEVQKLLVREAGELLVREPKLFDQFQKSGEDKISYAFRLVFQSQEKTLTDEEVSKIMERLTVLLNARLGWRVR